MSEHFGKDIRCGDSLKTGRYAAGVDVVSQNAIHRLTTPRGMLSGGDEEQNYGIDLPGMIGSTASASEAAAMPGKIRIELKKDKRISQVRSTIRASTSGPATTWAITIEVTTTDGGTFVLQASKVTVEKVGF